MNVARSFIKAIARGKSLIVTADDFGLAIEVNEAVEIAHVDGVLTCASLMVGAGATDDAVQRARRLPSLRVGLHLVLTDGRSLLPRSRIPSLVDRDGCFHAGMTRAAIALALRPEVHQQVAAEIDAQFAAFAKTGLPLDHVNAHKHFQLHPVIARLMIEIGSRYGLRAMRVPSEPLTLLRRIDATTSMAPSLLAPYTMLLRRRIGQAGLRTADRVVGNAWSGAMTASRIAGLLDRLPEGVTELYTHPATADGFDGSAVGYRYVDELVALIDPATRESLKTTKTRLATFTGPART